MTPDSSSATVLPAFQRMRRLRHNAALRNFARETTLNISDFIYPLFVADGAGLRKEILSMPGQYQLSLDHLDAEIDDLINLGIGGVLMDKLTRVTELCVQGQAEAGADIIRLFDSWLGLLGPEAYREFVAPYTARIFAALKDCSRTIHFSTGTAHLLPDIAATDPDLISIDWRLSLSRCWEIIGDDKGIQGNLDPALLMTPWEAVERSARQILQQAGGRPGHIFNLGHGVIPQTDFTQLQRLTEFVHA